MSFGTGGAYKKAVTVVWAVEQVTTNQSSSGEVMAKVEKKSLISSRAAAKKAILASKSTNLSKGTGIGLSKGTGVGLSKGTGVGLSKGTGVGLSKGTGVGLSKGTGVGLSK